MMFRCSMKNQKQKEEEQILMSQTKEAYDFTRTVSQSTTSRNDLLKKRQRMTFHSCYYKTPAAIDGLMELRLQYQMAAIDVPMRYGFNIKTPAAIDGLRSYGFKKPQWYER